MQLEDLLERLDGVRLSPGGYTAQCPAHEDEVNSLSVWDSETHIGLKCYANCPRRRICEEIGIWERDLYYDQETAVTMAEAEAVYPYHDESGTLLYEVVRFPGKRLRPRKPNGEWGIEGIRRVLYRLPELVQFSRRHSQHWLGCNWDIPPLVYIVEGEKDVESIMREREKEHATVLNALGFATTPPFGAGKWKASYVKYFLGLRVVIVADRDSERSDGSSPGLDHAREIADSLEGIAESVRIVQSRAGKDVTDHLEAGFTLAELEEV